MTRGRARPRRRSSTARWPGCACTPRTEDDLPIGQYAMVAIQDTGTGMPPEVAARVLEWMSCWARA